ncbi:MAG: GTPase HflX [Anaerolineales bacterium]|nr:GTPase HflX [Anaerolineales bacterium]
MPRSRLAQYHSKKAPIATRSERERAFLVGVELADSGRLLGVEDSLAELELLAEAAGLVVVGQATQRLRTPDPKTFLGSGKVREVQSLVEETLADLVLFDDELSPRHQRELEDLFGEDVRVLDRTALILDIFAQHARTREGALQVELAQYAYRLPRLTRAWTHLARQAGGGAGRSGSVGGVGLRGPGETQLEVDRREIGRRMAHLRQELDKVRAHRQRHRSQRRKAALPTVALVGYTNAGKSTLLNRLAQADVFVADQPFATLDPTTRRIQLPGGRQVLLTDTVGFIQKLPTALIAAFRATLEEIGEADLLLHVVDITHPHAQAQSEAVMRTLEEIQAGEIPVVTALNKIDLRPDPGFAIDRVDDFERAVPVSALTGDGTESLLNAIELELYQGMSEVDVRIPYSEARLASLMREQGQLLEERHLARTIVLRGRVPNHLVSAYRPFMKSASARQANGTQDTEPE